MTKLINDIAMQLRDIQYPNTAREDFEITPKDIWENTTTSHQNELILQVNEFVKAVRCAGYEILNVPSGDDNG